MTKRWATFGIAASILLISSFGLPLEAKGRLRRRPAPPPRLDVLPAPELDARVTMEVSRAREILANLNTDNLLASPYLVSAVYYHDGFLSDFPADRASADPERRIVAQISSLLDADAKTRFVSLLHQIWQQSAARPSGELARPLASWAFGAASRTHRYALDLFTSEGAPVYSASAGIVVLADGGWTPDDLFSTSSRKGGNAVIVFDPAADRFYRYCHLSAVLVARGDRIAAGDPIGRVGHTGFNASLPGHGRHLHFEVNQLAGGRVEALDRAHLRALLAPFAPPPTVSRRTPPPARRRRVTAARRVTRS